MSMISENKLELLLLLLTLLLPVRLKAGLPLSTLEAQVPAQTRPDQRLVHLFISTKLMPQRLALWLQVVMPCWPGGREALSTTQLLDYLKEHHLIARPSLTTTLDSSGKVPLRSASVSMEVGLLPGYVVCQLSLLLLRQKPTFQALAALRPPQVQLESTILASTR